MSAREFVGWRIFAQVEPFGQERGDLRAAVQTAAIVNAIYASVGAKLSRKSEDFLLDFDARWAGDDEPDEPDEETARREAEEHARAIFAKVSAAREIMSGV